MFHIFHSAALQTFLVSCESASDLMKPKPGTGEARSKSGWLGSVDFGEDRRVVEEHVKPINIGVLRKKARRKERQGWKGSIRGFSQSFRLL